jgi:hypothetical protein
MSTSFRPPRPPRPSTPTGIPPATAYRPAGRLSYGTVCSSNINRSMEAHVVLGNAGTYDTIRYDDDDDDDDDDDTIRYDTITSAIQGERNEATRC